MRSVTGAVAVLRGPLVRQAGIYAVSNVLSRVAPFLLLPILTRHLSPSDFGLVAMFLLIAVLLEPIVNLGLPGALTVKHYEPETDLRIFLGTGLAAVLVCGGLAAVALWALGGVLSSATKVPPAWILVVIPLVLARSVTSSLMALLRVREMAAAYGVIQNLQTLTFVGLALLFVVALESGWQGRIGAEVVAAGAFGLVAIGWLSRRSEIRWEWRPEYLRQLLRFGIPLIPHAIGSVLIVQTDRLLLTNLVGLDETGLYTVAYQLALPIEILALSFNNAYAPWLFRTLAHADRTTGPSLVRLTYLQFAVMGIVALGVAFAMPWLAATFLDPRFDGASEYVGWLALGLWFGAMYYMVTNYIFFAKRTEWLAVVTFVTALVNIPVTYLLIRANGGVGAAQGFAIAMGTSFVLTWLASQRAYPMPWLSSWRTT